MNILWITNTIFPEPSRVLGLPEPVFGGWIYDLAMKVASSPGVRLAVATVYHGKKIMIYDIE